MSGFSLWEQPWIPVVTADGQSVKVGLGMALSAAHRIRGIEDPSPLVTVSLHRLLLALLYRTHPLEHPAQWCTLWKAGRLDETAIRQYGQRWSERFDLLHPTRPFYQVTTLPEEKEHPVADLLLEAAHGNNPTLFDHGLVEGQSDIALDRAACYLIALQLFAIGGGVSKPFNRMDGPLTKGIVVEAAGESLFETLLLNAPSMEQWEDLAPPERADAPFWELDAPPAPVKTGTAVRGPLHYLTWQSRRVQLLIDRQRGVVTGCKVAQQYCLPKDGGKVDPGKAYRRDDKQGWVALRLQKDRAAWRLTHALLQPTLQDQARPEIVTWLAVLRRRERLGDVVLPQAVSLVVSGLTTDPKLAAKIDLWRREEVGLPLALLEEPELIRELDRMMATAAGVEAHLRRTSEAVLWALAERPQQAEALRYLWTGKGAKIPPAIPALARGLGATLRFWSAMEGPFRAALWALSGQGAEAAWSGWREAMRQQATTAMTSALQGLQAAGAPWEPLSRVEDAFVRRLPRVLEQDPSGEGDDDAADTGIDAD